MIPAELEKLVFDCNVFCEALINIRGPAGACVEAARAGRITLFVSDYVLQEIRELPEKLPAKYNVTPERAEGLIRDLLKYAKMVGGVPSVYVVEADHDDSHYVDLAAATGARIIASRDKHLSGLMDQTKPVGKAFRERFPTIDVVKPEAFLAQLRTREREQGVELDRQQDAARVREETRRRLEEQRRAELERSRDDDERER